MPLTPTTMRMGESLTLSVELRDHLGVVVKDVEANDPEWTQDEPPNDVIGLVPDGMEATITAEAPGSDVVRFSATDDLGDERTAALPVTVLDASRLVFEIRARENCSAAFVGDVLVVHPTAAGTPTVTLQIHGVDSRDEVPQPTYILAQKDVSTATQKILFGDPPSPTSTGTNPIECTIVDSGQETVLFEVVTDETATEINQSLTVEISTLATVTIGYAPA